MAAARPPKYVSPAASIFATRSRASSTLSPVSFAPFNSLLKSSFMSFDGCVTSVLYAASVFWTCSLALPTALDVSSPAFTNCPVSLTPSVCADGKATADIHIAAVVAVMTETSLLTESYA